ncbi:AAA family ATPase [Vibrio chaetopteri]|uniref:AAA family ATPase n=1 Tax=Vibrio chaetopteri TaxID=3016528 RepID=UPI003AB8628F
MQEKRKLDKLVVIKSGQLNDNQGFLTPILRLNDEEQCLPIAKEEYPADILLSKGYQIIDVRYDVDEAFLLNNHNWDAEKTAQHGANRYWARDEKSISDLPAGMLMPVIYGELPDKVNGMLPEGVIPPEKPFFIMDADYLYGPLKASETDEARYIVEPHVHPSLSFGKGYLGRFPTQDISDILVESKNNDTAYLYVATLKGLASYRKTDSAIDYLSDDQLIKVVNQIGFGKNSKRLAKKEADKLQQAIVASEKANRFSKQDERLERLKQILDRYLSHSDTGFELVDQYLNSVPGREFLTQYVESNKTDLLTDFLDQVKADAQNEERVIKEKLAELQNQLAVKTSEIDAISKQVKQKRIQAQEEIDQIAIETEDAVRESLKAKQEELSNDIVNKEEELEKLKNDYNVKLSEMQLVDDIDKLERRCNYLEEHGKNLESAAKGFENTLKSNDTEGLAKKIGEMEAINRVLAGKSTARSGSSKVHTPITFCQTEPDSKEGVIDALCNHFCQDGGRVFSRDEMTNLVVSINQSFLTVLSGPPGTGKTSTATRLASAMHLGDSSGDQNFLHVPVGRGWVSSRDTLGFYNSLKDVYQESRTGLYSFLSKSDSEDAMRLILLDEANLSSMEHYWSDFLGLCDMENLSRPIDTGIPGKGRFLHIGSKTRFLATINNDATTERLSPRLIDRVPVITLDSITPHVSDAFTFELDGAMSFSKMQELFIPEDASLSKSDESQLNKVIDTLVLRDQQLGQPVPISHRKRIAVTNYVDVAGALIGSEPAMDFAIMQHILPQIEGYGTQFRKRLENLNSLLSKSYPRSAEQLDRVISCGNEFTGSYSFFQ